MGQSSCNQVDKVTLCESRAAVDQSSTNLVSGANKKFNSCFFYNSAVSPTTVDSLLAKKIWFRKCQKTIQEESVEYKSYS